jgi:hypothetical protein
MSKVIKPTQAYIDESRAKVLLEKWGPVLNYNSDNVAPIEDDHTRLNTAMLLENQESWCLNEANVSGGSGSSFGSSGGSTTGPTFPGGSDSYASNDARLPKILIPMIRRTFPELLTNELVGVQPMSGPVGLAFALRYKYSDKMLGETNSNHKDGVADANSGPAGTQGAYSDAHSVANTPGANQPGNNVDGELGYQYLDTRFTGKSSGNTVGGLTASIAATTSGHFGLSTGQGTVAWDQLAQDSGVAALLGEFELGSNIPTIEVSFEKTAVEAGTRRLAANWSVELEQDLKNMNGIDIDTELTNAMSYELQAEIDREMIVRMIQTALQAGKGAGYSAWFAGSADGRWMAERNRDLYAKLIVEANRIAIRNRRGAANFIVASPAVCAILEMLPEFTWMPVNGNVNTQPVGVAKVGNLGGRFNVYRDTRTEAQREQGLRSTQVEYALLGYKGPEFYDTGIIYCPYIPVMVQRTIGPNDFSPRVGLLTRYGVVDNIFGAELYYHVVLVGGLKGGLSSSHLS